MSRRSKDQIIYEVHNHNIDAERRQIYLHSYYVKDDEGEPGVDYRQATTFIKNLHIIDRPPNHSICIHMHSVGGCWDNGMAIFNSICLSQSHITILAYSQASSMSGIILQSADLRVLMPDCHFLMHYGSSGGAMSHPVALHNEAVMQMKACDRMISIFASSAFNSNKASFWLKKKSTTYESIRKFFKEKLLKEVDWYLDAQEAIDYGLADEILGNENYPTIDSLRLKD